MLGNALKTATCSLVLIVAPLLEKYPHFSLSEFSLKITSGCILTFSTDFTSVVHYIHCFLISIITIRLPNTGINAWHVVISTK